MLKEKADAIWYHGSQAVLRNLDVTAAQLDGGSVKLLVNPEAEAGCGWYYKLGNAAEQVDYEMDVSGWDRLTHSGAVIAAGDSAVVTVAEAGSDGKAKAFGTAVL